MWNIIQSNINSLLSMKSIHPQLSLFQSQLLIYTFHLFIIWYIHVYYFLPNTSSVMLCSSNSVTNTPWAKMVNEFRTVSHQTESLFTLFIYFSQRQNLNFEHSVSCFGGIECPTYIIYMTYYVAMWVMRLADMSKRLGQCSKQNERMTAEDEHFMTYVVRDKTRFDSDGLIHHQFKINIPRMHKCV